MGYAEEIDLETRFGEKLLTLVADRDQDGKIDDGVVESALADASAEIDSYLGQIFSLPLSSTPELLVRVCGDIAIYRMAIDAGTLTAEMRLRYEDALRWLEKVATGKAGLGDYTESTGADDVKSHGPERVFSRSTLRGVF